MDIAAMSMVLSNAKVQQQAGLTVMKIAMDTGKERMNNLVKMFNDNNLTLARAAQPHLGNVIDIKL